MTRKPMRHDLRRQTPQAPTFPGNGSPATSAILPLPQSVVDENGDVIITSMAQNAVFTVNVANGTIYALAGSGRAGFAGASRQATRRDIFATG